LKIQTSRLLLVESVSLLKFVDSGILVERGRLAHR
jgi:hypothetical protein